jgi:hypothetical protein
MLKYIKNIILLSQKNTKYFYKLFMKVKVSKTLLILSLILILVQTSWIKED